MKRNSLFIIRNLKDLYISQGFDMQSAEKTVFNDSYTDNFIVYEFFSSETGIRDLYQKNPGIQGYGLKKAAGRFQNG